nr:unnamed protein product [Haemonchus contortus]
MGVESRGSALDALAPTGINPVVRRQPGPGRRPFLWCLLTETRRPYALSPPPLAWPLPLLSTDEKPIPSADQMY